MTTTRRTLLQRVRDAGDREAWEQFFELYVPLIEGYARAQGLVRDDIEEVRDQCLELLARKLPEFEYDRQRGSFQAWLHRIVRGKVIDLQRAREVRSGERVELDELDAGAPGNDALWERQWRAEHLRYALEKVRARESEERYRVFEMLLLEELDVPGVSARTGLRPAQIYKIKASVLARVRATLERLGTQAEDAL